MLSLVISDQHHGGRAGTAKATLPVTSTIDHFASIQLDSELLCRTFVFFCAVFKFPSSDPTCPKFVGTRNMAITVCVAVECPVLLGAEVRKIPPTDITTYRYRLSEQGQLLLYVLKISLLDSQVPTRSYITEKLLTYYRYAT